MRKLIRPNHRRNDSVNRVHTQAVGVSRRVHRARVRLVVANSRRPRARARVRRGPSLHADRRQCTQRPRRRRRARVMLRLSLWAALAYVVDSESGPWPLKTAKPHVHAHERHAALPVREIEPTAGDPLRTRVPPAALAPMLPLQWGTVNPTGWIRDWAEAASNGAVSPEVSWFASGNETNGRANGWKNGQPAWAMDEQSAYWIDGMTRLGLVLNDSRLLARVEEDITGVIAGNAFGEPGGGPEGWPRSVYSRAMLAYLDGTGDKKVLDFFSTVWNGSYHMDNAKDARSMTQAEAMLEGYAYGGSEELRAVALEGLIAHQDSFQKAWNSPRCANYSTMSSCVENSYELEHGVTWNELAKLWALAAPWSDAEHSTEWMNASINAYELMQLLRIS